MIDRSKTNNFTDLKIKTISVKTINKEVKGECDNTETSKTFYRTLKFKNGSTGNSVGFQFLFSMLFRISFA